MSGRLIGKASTVNLTTMSRKRHISAALVTFVELHVQLESGFQNSLYTSAVNFPRIKYFMRVSFLNFQIDPKNHLSAGAKLAKHETLPAYCVELLSLFFGANQLES
jgi:hypothetical protein